MVIFGLILFSFGFVCGLLISYVGLTEDNAKLTAENKILKESEKALTQKILEIERRDITII